MQQNPFAPRSPAPPEAFVNREREIDLIFGHIKSAQRGNVAINGPLGIGKTSLLRFVANPTIAAAHGVEAPEYALIYCDIQSVAPFSPARFWHRVARLLARAPVGLEEPAGTLQAIPTPDITDLEEFLDQLADRGTTLVLLLDEFEWALQVDTPQAEAESRNFLAQLASLARRTPRALCLMVATEEPLPEVTRVIESWRGSPFPTIFIAATLRPISRMAVDRLLDKALGTPEEARRLLTAEDRELLHRFIAGQPAALQAAAFSLFQGRRLGATPEQLRESARAAAALAVEALSSPATSSGPAEAPSTDDGAAVSRGLWIDTQTGDVFVEGQRVESLTALEYSLLRLLYAHAGRLCSKQEIIRQVWGTEFVGRIDDSRVEKLVSRLRRKIEPVPGRPQYVRTVRGQGYRFVP